MCVQMNKMRDDQDFNIHFVKIIEHERSLYDKSLPEYRSKEEHERIWQKISTEVNESGKFKTPINTEYVRKIAYETSQNGNSHFRGLSYPHFILHFHSNK